MLDKAIRKKLVEQTLAGVEQQLFRTELALEMEEATGVTPPGYDEAIKRLKIKIEVAQKKIEEIDKEV